MAPRDQIDRMTMAGEALVEPALGVLGAVATALGFAVTIEMEATSEATRAADNFGFWLSSGPL